TALESRARVRLVAGGGGEVATSHRDEFGGPLDSVANRVVGLRLPASVRVEYFKQNEREVVPVGGEVPAPGAQGEACWLSCGFEHERLDLAPVFQPGDPEFPGCVCDFEGGLVGIRSASGSFAHELIFAVEPHRFVM